MRICVIILDYCGASKTEACLNALVGQGIETAIVVDNGADTAASDNLMRSIEQVKRNPDGFIIKVIHSEINLGFAKGVNLALRSDRDTAHSHDAYLLINNDAQALPDMIHHLSTELKNGTDLVAPTVISDSGQRQGIMWYNRYLGMQSSRWFPLSFPFVSGCCLMLRHDLLGKRDLFDESFFMYGEDVYLGWQIRQTEKTFCCLDSTAVKHSHIGSSTQGNFFYEYHIVRSHLLLTLKTWHYPIEIPFMLAAKLLSLTCRALTRSVRYRSPTPVLALLLGLFPLAIWNP